MSRYNHDYGRYDHIDPEAFSSMYPMDGPYPATVCHGCGSQLVGDDDSDDPEALWCREPGCGASVTLDTGPEDEY